MSLHSAGRFGSKRRQFASLDTNCHVLVLFSQACRRNPAPGAEVKPLPEAHRDDQDSIELARLVLAELQR